MKFNLRHSGKAIMKGKSATIITMLLIIISLYGVSYALFLRTVEVDVTKDASITYRGETGTASVKVENKMKAYNQRIQEFMDSITYQVTPSENISNGDTITIMAAYNEDLARRYNIKALQMKREIVVGNLPVRFASVDEIPQKLLNNIKKQGETYVKNNLNNILEEDFTTFYVKAEPELLDYELKYRVFLGSKQSSVKDKIVEVYTIKAKGDVSVSSEEEVLEESEETIFYMITFNEMNTSLKILDENVYGEKMIVSASYDLSTHDGFQMYMNAKYNDNYVVSFLNISKKK